MSSFRRTVREAVKFFLKNGFTSRNDLEHWQGILRHAAEDETGDDYASMVISHLRRTYSTQVDGAAALKRHPGISRFTIHHLEPKLRAELDRRILASVDLIKLNRKKAVDTTLSRFSGWATSIPPADSIALTGVQKEIRGSASHIQKSAEQSDFEARRVMIDQNHKLIANVHNIIATDNNAIAAVWHSHWRQAGYNYREDHKERDQKIYLIRGNWAQKNGYIRPGAAGYLDEITQPGEEVFCVPEDSLLEFADDVTEGYRHWYCGKLTVITTSSGKTLRVTGNLLGVNYIGRYASTTLAISGLFLN